MLIVADVVSIVLFAVITQRMTVISPMLPSLLFIVLFLSPLRNRVWESFRCLVSVNLPSNVEQESC